MVRKCLLIEIALCLQLKPIGSLWATWVCFEPKPMWQVRFPAIMT